MDYDMYHQDRYIEVLLYMLRVTQKMCQYFYFLNLCLILICNSMELGFPGFMNPSQFQHYIASFAEETVKRAPSLSAGFTTSFLTILVCEVGDKTFFLAMIMATRYSQFVVFLGAYGALFVMTILSTAFGKIATAWISPIFTNIIVTVLFFYFGIKMLLDAKKHQAEEQNEQLKEVEHQLQEMENKYIQRYSRSQPLIPENATNNQNTVTKTGEKKTSKPVIPSSYILTQAFIMTFLAEWGDRYQIATIALAASFNVYMVTLGALLGHFICTVGAVKLGTWISGKITQKQILTIGGVVFIISGLCTAALFIDNIYDNQHVPPVK